MAKVVYELDSKDGEIVELPIYRLVGKNKDLFAPALDLLKILEEGAKSEGANDVITMFKVLSKDPNFIPVCMAFLGAEEGDPILEELSYMDYINILTIGANREFKLTASNKAFNQAQKN